METHFTHAAHPRLGLLVVLLQLPTQVASRLRPHYKLSPLRVRIRKARRDLEVPHKHGRCPAGIFLIFFAASRRAAGLLSIHRSADTLLCRRTAAKWRCPVSARVLLVTPVGIRIMWGLRRECFLVS